MNIIETAIEGFSILLRWEIYLGVCLYYLIFTPIRLLTLKKKFLFSAYISTPFQAFAELYLYSSLATVLWFNSEPEWFNIFKIFNADAIIYLILGIVCLSYILIYTSASLFGMLFLGILFLYFFAVGASSNEIAFIPDTTIVLAFFLDIFLIWVILKILLYVNFYFTKSPITNGFLYLPICKVLAFIPLSIWGNWIGNQI